MEIYFDRSSYVHADEIVELDKKMGKNEKIVRHKLVEVWTKLLEKYAHPGVPIPSVEFTRAELFRVGVNAGVKAVVDDNWFLFSFMVRDEIEHEVKKGLNQLDIPLLLDYLKEAQQNPKVLEYLRKQIRHYVLGE